MSTDAVTRAAVLDLGSNSFHVLVADVSGPHVDPVAREREMLHLGRSIARDGAPDEGTVRRAVATIERQLRLARRTGAEESVAVATAALREPGAAVLLERLTDVLGRPPTVLHAHEEARLAFLGAQASAADGDLPTLVLDLGGGSLELAVGSGTRIDATASARLGASRLSAMVAHDPPDEDELAELITWIDGELATIVTQVGHHQVARVIAVGGTVRALARHLAARTGRWLPASVNRAPLDRAELEDATDVLIAATTQERAELPGVRSRRADHLHLAGLVLSRTLASLGLERAEVSDWGLREGLLLDRFGAIAAIPSAERRTHEVDRLLRASRREVVTGRRLARVAVRIDEALDAAAPDAAPDAVDSAVTIGAREERTTLLEAAARLHDIGATLPLRRAHEHGAYVIEQAELRGFSPRELALVLTVVRFLPSRGVSRRYPPFAALDPADRALARRLLVVLRLASVLDPDDAGEVVAVRCERGRLEVTLRTDVAAIDRLQRDVADLAPRLREELGIDVVVGPLPGG